MMDARGQGGMVDSVQFVARCVKWCVTREYSATAIPSFERRCDGRKIQEGWRDDGAGS